MRSSKQKDHPRSNRGFTLIELLVVIAIIAVLTGIGLASFQGAQAKARDAKRKGDLKAIQTALQAYYNDNGHFPITCTPGTGIQADAGGACWNADCWNSVGTNSNWIPDNGNYNLFSSQYMKSVPHDPSGICQWPYGDWGNGTGGATYAYASDGQTYALAVRLENHNDSQTTQIVKYQFPSNWTTGSTDTSTYAGPGEPFTYWIFNP